MTILTILVLYLIPTIVVLVRKRPNGISVILINVLLGWTFIGWVVALVMAFSTPKISAAPVLTPKQGADNVITARGAGGSMTFDGRDVVINRSGGLSLLIHGLAGEKSIAIYAIQAVQLRQAKFGVRGYLQLTVMGGMENRGGAVGAAGDENSVLFDVADQPAFERMAEVIRQAIHTSRSPAQAPMQSSSLADELQKLAALRDQGALTDDEFSAQKAKLLG